jgi:hypothetical protein
VTSDDDDVPIRVDFATPQPHANMALWCATNPVAAATS